MTPQDSDDQKANWGELPKVTQYMNECQGCTEIAEEIKKLRELLDRAMKWVHGNHEFPAYSELISDYEDLLKGGEK